MLEAQLTDARMVRKPQGAMDMRQLPNEVHILPVERRRQKKEPGDDWLMELPEDL